MKWYKHFSTMRYDKRIKRLIRKFGLKGYGLYNYILEGVAFNLDPQSPMPEIEENAHDLAQELGEDTIEIEEILKYCLTEELFQVNKDTGRVMCLKMLTHLDNTLSQNPEIKKILSNFKKLEDNLSDLKQIRLDKNRIDKNRIEENRKDTMTKEQQDLISKLYDLNIHEDITYPRISKEFKSLCNEYDMNILVTLPTQYQEYLEQNKGNDTKYIKRIPNWLKDKMFSTAWKEKPKELTPVQKQDLFYEFVSDKVTEDRRKEIWTKLDRMQKLNLKLYDIDLEKYGGVK
jgi:hypothetical protein